MTRRTRQAASTRTRRQATCLASATATLNSKVHPHERTPIPNSLGADAPETVAAWIRSSHRLLVMRGLSPTEAANVVAWVAGLHSTDSGWSIREIEQLVALRSLAACGVIAR